MHIIVIEIIKEWTKTNLYWIVTTYLMFGVGIGAGAAIQQAINEWTKKREIIKYKDGKITNEYSKAVLETMLIIMKNILSETEKDAIQCAIDILD